DPSKRVVMQTALSLGNFSSDQVVAALADIVAKNYKDQWIRMSVLSSDAGSSIELLNLLDKNTEFFQSWDGDKERFLRDFTYVTSARNDESSMMALIENFDRLPAESQNSIWKAVADGVKKSKATLSEKVKEKINKIVATGSDSVKEVL